MVQVFRLSFLYHNTAFAKEIVFHYVPRNAGTLLSSEQERGWQTAHSPWQGLQLGTPRLLNYETPRLGLRFITFQNLRV